MIKRDTTERDKKAISIIFAYFISISYITRLYGTTFHTGGMAFALTAFGALMVLFYKTMVKVEISAFVLSFGLIVALYYAVTRQVAYTTVDIRKFLFYFCAVSVLAMYRCDVEKFLRYSSYMSLLIWPFYNQYFVEMTAAEGGYMTMGTSYALFPLLAAPCFHFLFYRKTKKYKLMYVIYIVSVFLLTLVAINGTRGIILSIFVGLGLIYIKGLNEKNASRYHMLRAISLLILTVVLLVYFYEILEFVHEFLKSLDINVRFIEKTIMLNSQGDLSNGRWKLFEYTIREIIKKPIAGHGIAAMAYYGGGHNYAHNFLLQLMYDGGLILTIPVLFFLIKSVYYIFCGDDRDEMVFALFLFSVTIPRSFFSGDVWENPSFWLLIMHSAKYYNFKRKTGFKAALQPVVVNQESEEPKEEGAEL